MTQEAIEISTTPPLPGLKLVQDVNKALQTIATDFAGATDPAGLPGCVPYCTWADTGNMLLKRRNAANTAWEVEGALFLNPGTDHAGPEPANPVPFMTWADTASGLRKRRNAANTDWVVEAPLLARSAFAATHSGSGQSIPASTYTKVNLSVAYYDYNSEFNTSNSRFTAKIDGVYHFDATANISAASQVENAISIYKNGVEHLWTSVPSSTLHLRSSPMCSGDIILSVGDYVEMYAFSSVAGSTATQVSRTWLSGHLVRAL